MMRKIPVGYNAAIAVCSRAPFHGLIIADGKMINACTNFDVRCRAGGEVHIEIGSDLVHNDLCSGNLLSAEELECAKTLMMMIPTKLLVEELEKREGVTVKTLNPGSIVTASVTGPARLLTVID